MADDNLDSHKHRRKKTAGTPEWSETCLGIWTKNNKGSSGEHVKRKCRGISILHLNKYADSKKVKNIPTQGVEIIIREESEIKRRNEVEEILENLLLVACCWDDNFKLESNRDEAIAQHNLHPFLGIFVDEQDNSRKDKHTKSPNQKSDGDKSQDVQSDEATPKILQKVTENWENRWHDAGEKVKKYYHDPRSSTEIITDMKNTISKSYETTARILSYCHPQEKAKQVSSFITEHLKDLSKWWKE